MGGRGSAHDLAGMRYENLRVLLQNEELRGGNGAHARAQVPEEVATALRLGRMTARQKDSGKVRRIAAGSVLRRHAFKAVVKQYGEKLMAATVSFQYAIQTRHNTGVMAHLLRKLTDADEDTVLV